MTHTWELRFFPIVPETWNIGCFPSHRLWADRARDSQGNVWEGAEASRPYGLLCDSSPPPGLDIQDQGTRWRRYRDGDCEIGSLGDQDVGQARGDLEMKFRGVSRIGKSKGSEQLAKAWGVLESDLPRTSCCYLSQHRPPTQPAAWRAPEGKTRLLTLARTPSTCGGRGGHSRSVSELGVS